MIKAIGIASSIIAGSIVSYNHLKYIDAPDAPVIQNVETNLYNPKAPTNKVDFTSKVMDKNLLYVTGFEDGDIPIKYKYSYFPPGHNREFGGQTRTDSISKEGSYSTRIEDTYSNGNYDRGNDIHGIHLGYEDFSYMRYDGKLQLPDNAYLSISMDAMSEADSGKVRPMGYGGTTDKPISLLDLKFLEDVNKGDTIIKVSGLSETIKDNVDSGVSYRVVYKDNSDKILGDYYHTRIKNVDLDSSIITLERPMETEFMKGENVLTPAWRVPVSFPEVVIDKKNQWVNIQSNSYVNNEGFSVSKRGLEFYLQTWTRNVLYIDNIRFGYANQVKINRNGQEIYSGYHTSVEDKTAKDVDNPNKVESIQSNIILKDSSTNQIKINFTAPEDNGTEYIYTATASFDGKESRVSEPVKSVVKTGVDGYSYVIDTNPITEPNNTINVRETSITKDVPNDGSTYYLHIKAIDKAGNTSETTHKKIAVHKTAISLAEENGEVRLNWDFSDSDLSNYYFKILRKENEGEFEELIVNTTDVNYLDVNVLDKEVPNKPILKSTNYNKLDNKFEFVFNDSVDIGTTYYYYVETYLNDNSKVSTSNIVSVNITSGLKGYSYVINNNENFAPDDTINDFAENKICVPVSNSDNYIHIKAIDNQGNVSDVLSIKAYDDINPSLDLRLTDYRPNNTGLSIIATGQDNMVVKSIKLPNGNIINDRTVNFKVNKNGEYSFTVYDVAGNSFTKSITVTNIDKTPPTIEFEEFKEGDEYKIKVIAKDEGSGISHIILPNGDRVNSDNHIITAESNTMYEFKAYDLAGNSSTRSTQVGILESKDATANLDIYIKSENMLSLSLNNNSILFNNFNGTEDFEQNGALELSINSSLPYEINAYLEKEIQNVDKSETMDKKILKLKESSNNNYKEFTDIQTKLPLLAHSDAGNNKIHIFDFKLDGGMAHKKDIYKTTIKFEVIQK